MLEDQNKILIFNQLQNGLFHDTGWLESYHKKESLDENGQAVFWYSYPAIYFLKERLQKHLRIFEYGSGNSTLCYARLCQEIITVESNQSWFDLMQSKIPDNVKLILQKNLNKFPEEILNFHQQFDIIAIDSKERVKCAKICLEKLSKSGVIIFDNTERNQYEEAFHFLYDNNFKRLDFFGHSPINVTIKITSVFYRQHNVLGI